MMEAGGRFSLFLLHGYVGMALAHCFLSGAFLARTFSSYFFLSFPCSLLKKTLSPNL